MLTALGFGMVLTFMLLVLSGRLSALVALILVPIVFGLIAGVRADLGPMMFDGVKTLAPTGVMLLFAILYFSLITDAGLFDPLIRITLKLVRDDPLWVLVGTVGIGLLTALDGDGAPTYVICVSALGPVYKRMGLRNQHLSILLMLCAGTMHLVPWGGPTARAAAAMHVDVSAVFLPLIPVMCAGALYTLAVAVLLGVGERRRLGKLSVAAGALASRSEPDPVGAAGRSRAGGPRLFAFNLCLTITLIAGMISQVMPISILFMIATALALAVNFPEIQRQRERIAAHAYTALAVVSLVFAAGILTGILSGSGMLAAMSSSILAATPTWAGAYLAPVTSLLSGPATYLISNDAFYFGVLPALAKTAATYGITPLQMARASVVGQPLHMLSPLVASTYLLVSMLELNYGKNQLRSVLWVLGLIVIMVSTSLILGVVPLHVR